MKKALLFASAALAFLAGCNDAIDDPLNSSKSIVLSATREGMSPGTKTQVMDGGAVWWQAAEEISVFYAEGEGGIRFVSRNTEPAASAEFVQADPGADVEAEDCWAVYPYSADNAFDGTSLTVTVPSLQTASEGNFSGDAFPAVARSDSRELAFRNICGGVMFSLSRSDVKSVIFKANGDVALAGRVRLSIGDDGIPKVLEVIDGASEVTLEAPDGGCFKPGSGYYMSLLPAALASGFSMSFVTASSLGEFTSPDARELRRSVFGVLSDADLHVSGWKDPNAEGKLSGTVIGTRAAVNYDTGNVSYTVNTRNNVFDGDFNTYFASYERSRTWVGLDLGEKHVITRIGYSPRITQEGRVELALLEGANEADFIDALPLAIIKEKGVSGVMQYIDCQCSRGFRYVRYVGPSDARCNLAELEFYGRPGEGDDSRFCQLTNLPTVVINTQGAQDIVSKEEYILSNVYIISGDGSELMSTAETKVRGRGNASWNFPKKPYKIKFAEKQNVLGAPASAKQWTLISNYGDKTLMRNILAFEVSRRVGMAYTPFCTPVDVILNGEYQGCYQLCDQVEVGNGRVDAKKGYLIEIDAYASSEQVYFYSSYGIPVTVKYPDDDEITGEQFSFIQGFFGSMEDALFSSGYQDHTTGYRKYLDVDSFLRNFIVGEFSGNTDTYWSVNMYKQDATDGVFFTGPVWDYDLAFDNDGRTYPINNLGDFIFCTNGSVASGAVREMVNRIVKYDSDSHAKLEQIWDEVKPALADLNDYVDATAALLDESQQLNFKRWPILNSYVHENPQVSGSYEGEVAVVKKYITGRLTKFDQLVH